MSSNVDNDSFGKIYEKELCANRLDDVTAEVVRLQSDKKVQKVFNQVKGFLSKRHKMALGHVAEIRNRFKKHYYVFMHGQNSDLMIVNLVAEKLQEIVKGKPSVAAIPLRHPCFTKSAKACHDPQWYRKQCDSSGGVGDASFKTELVCGDALLSSTSAWESANFFAAPGNKNCLPGSLDTFVMDNLTKQLKNTFPHQNVYPLLEIFKKLFVKIPKHASSGGNLYAICVPKKKFSKCGYISSRWGVTHPLSATRTDQEIVEKLQNDDTNFGKENSLLKVIPQIRLVTSRLTPDNGVRIIQESLLPEKLVKWVEAIIEEVIERAYKGENFASIKKDIFARGFKKKIKSTLEEESKDKKISEISETGAIKEISNNGKGTEESIGKLFNSLFEMLSKFITWIFNKIFLIGKEEETAL